MQEKISIKSRYSLDSNDINDDVKNTSLIEFPKTISRKRVLNRAWVWFEGNGCSRIPFFSDALKLSWKSEKDMIKSNGCIFYPYMMYESIENIK